jgi:competence protein CoiA
MMYADTAAGRAEAAPGLAGTCPSCGHACRPKCGKLVIWHWAHHARADCDPWAEPITEWHLGWQRAVPPERREVVMPPHRADIMTASGGVVEIQHSPVSVDTITEREDFYGEQMAWIFDATEANIAMRAVPPYGVRLRWKHARRSVAACRRLVLLDLGDRGVLRLRDFVPDGEMNAVLYTRASVEGWLRDGTPWERITLPSPPAPRGPRYADAEPVPDWSAYLQDFRHRWSGG